MNIYSQALILFGCIFVAPSLSRAEGCDISCPSGEVVNASVHGDADSSTVVCSCVPESTGMVSNADQGVDENAPPGPSIPYDNPDVGAGES